MTLVRPPLCGKSSTLQPSAWPEIEWQHKAVADIRAKGLTGSTQSTTAILTRWYQWPQRPTSSQTARDPVRRLYDQILLKNSPKNLPRLFLQAIWLGFDVKFD